MPRQPTGNPPGRPRKDGLPTGSAKPEPAPEPVVKVMRSPFDTRPIRDETESGDVCPQCFPALVGQRPRNVISCKHGTYYGS